MRHYTSCFSKDIPRSLGISRDITVTNGTTNKCYSPGQVAQLVGVLSHAPKVVGSIPGQGTCPCCKFDPQLGYVQEATNQCFSLSLSLSPLPASSLSKINEHLPG